MNTRANTQALVNAIAPVLNRYAKDMAFTVTIVAVGDDREESDRFVVCHAAYGCGEPIVAKRNVPVGGH